VGALMVLMGCARPSAPRASAPTPEKPRLGEPCVIRPTQASANAARRVLLEVALAQFDANAGGLAPGNPPARWGEDPRVTIAWSTLILADPNQKSHIAWTPATDANARVELRITPRFEPDSESIPIEVEMLQTGARASKAEDAKAFTTVPIASQQTVVLGFPGLGGSVIAVTPYSVRGEEQLAQLRSCKPGPWLESGSPSASLPPPN
jgi:hypothetical protein